VNFSRQRSPQPVPTSVEQLNQTKFAVQVIELNSDSAKIQRRWRARFRLEAPGGKDLDPEKGRARLEMSDRHHIQGDMTGLDPEDHHPRREGTQALGEIDLDPEKGRPHLEMSDMIPIQGNATGLGHLNSGKG
jgi:hypothetical protein